MLNIEKTEEGNKIVFALEGKLDTLTSPDLDAQVQDSLGDVKELIFDFTKLKYISSAGLRVILRTQQDMPEGGEMKIVGVDPIIMDIFDAVGFSEILNIE